MRKLNVTILVGVLAALIGFGLVIAYGSNVDKRVADGKRTHKVLVSKIPLRTGATPTQVKAYVETKDIPEAYLATGYLTNLDSVKGLVLVGPVGAGTQLTQSMFGQPNAAGSVAPSKGHIALAVQVDLSAGAARYITPGSAVDVFVTYQNVQKAGVSGGQTSANTAAFASSRTKLFVSGVNVLSVSVAVPQVKATDAKSTSTTDTTDAAGQSQVIAVLDVTPIDAERIVNAQTIGKIYLGLSAVQGKGDTHTTPTGVIPDDVVAANR